MMAATPALALRYPVGTDHPDIGVWTRYLAEDLEAVLTERVQTGSTTVTGDGSSTYATKTVVFPVPFATVPNVQLVNYGSDHIHLVALGDVTTTSCQVRVSNRTGTAYSVTRTVHWVATDL